MNNSINTVAPSKRSNILAFFLSVLFIAGVISLLTWAYAGITGMLNKPVPAMVKLADNQIFFGNLKGTTLCNYVALTQHVDEKTKRPNGQLDVVKGGQLYGGNGCLEIKEPIALIENLTPDSKLYSQINSQNAGR
jgi:hypothetical protein